MTISKTSTINNYIGKLSTPGEFAANVIRMLSGNFFAQIIAFCAAPIISRLYTPDDFGAMTLILTCISVTSILASLRYEQAIVLPKEDSDGKNLVILSMLLCLTISTSLAGTLLFIGKDISRYVTQFHGREDLILMIPLGICVYGFLQCFTFWQARKKNFSAISWNQILIQVPGAGTKIVAAGFIGSTAVWLVAGNIIGQLIAVAVLASISFSQIFNTKTKTGIGHLMDVASKYSDFPRFRAMNGFVNELSQNLPVFMLAYFFSNRVVGYFGLANSVLKKPVELFSQSMTNVFLQKIAESNANGRGLKRSLQKATYGLAAVGIVPFAILMISGKFLCVLIFGNSWATSGLYMQILVPWLFTLFINPPSTQVILVKRKLKFNLYFDVVTIVLRAVALYVGAWLTTEPWVAILLFSITSMLSNLFYIRYAFKISESDI